MQENYMSYDSLLGHRAGGLEWVQCFTCKLRDWIHFYSLHAAFIYSCQLFSCYLRYFIAVCCCSDRSYVVCKVVSLLCGTVVMYSWWSQEFPEGCGAFSAWLAWDNSIFFLDQWLCCFSYYKQLIKNYFPNVQHRNGESNIYVGKTWRQ